MDKITKFQLPDLKFKHNSMEDSKSSTVSNDTTESILTIEESFAYQNSMSEIGHNIVIKPKDEFPELISMTKDELDAIIKKAKDEVQPIIIEASQQENSLQNLDILKQEILEIKDRIDLELDGLLRKILDLSYAIAMKIAEVAMTNLSKVDLIQMLETKIQQLGFKSEVSLEVHSQEIIDLFSESNIEVSLNNDMLPGDYKIIWCNGFLEKKTAAISSQIEEIILNNIKK